MAKIKKTGRHTQALKAHRQSIKRWHRNLQWKKKAKEIIKDIEEAVQKRNKSLAQSKLSELFSVMDKIGSRNIYHPNKVARIKSKFARKVSLI